MKLYYLQDNSDSLRAFAAEQTRVVNGIDLFDKFQLNVNPPGRSDYRSHKLIRKLEIWDHHSTREQIQFHIYVSNVSRVLSFWLMNYSKHLSFLQQSQRYVKINAQDSVAVLKGYIKEVNDAYNELTKIVPEEDARYILPQGVHTNFIMSGNLQAFYLVSLELYKHEFPSEIFEFVDNVFNLLSEYSPFSVNEMEKKLFKDSVPPTEFKYNEKEVIPLSHVKKLFLDESTGLEALLKHSMVSFDVDLSTAAAHQLIRHRSMEKTILSMGDGYVVPPKINYNEKAKNIFENIVGTLFDAARDIDTQYLLPNAAVVHLHGTENLYDFIGNFIPLRTCKSSQWEIRKIAMNLRNEISKEFLQLPIGRCFYYSSKSRLSEIFPTRNCPEPKNVKTRCGIYTKNF